MTKKKQYSFDSRCHDLALHFLPARCSVVPALDTDAGYDETANKLAQTIQDVVENFLGQDDYPKRACKFCDAIKLANAIVHHPSCGRPRAAPTEEASR